MNRSLAAGAIKKKGEGVCLLTLVKKSEFSSKLLACVPENLIS
jgi:hypothetical protein